MSQEANPSSLNPVGHADGPLVEPINDHTEIQPPEADQEKEKNKQGNAH